jgi:hypothetical protein
MSAETRIVRVTEYKSSGHLLSAYWFSANTFRLFCESNTKSGGRYLLTVLMILAIKIVLVDIV